MSIGDVVMDFEGTYSQYLSLRQPGWVRKYPASKFAHTVYATPGSGLSAVLKLATSRRAGHVYVTDDSGDNPYDTLPSYWSREASAAAAGLRRPVNVRPLRVATLITRLEGGAGVLALRGAMALDPDRFRVTIITGSGNHLLDQAAAAGLEVIIEPSLRTPIHPRDDLRALAP